MSLLILVAAADHPAPDAWVLDQAQLEAGRAGVVLGDYQGREDTLPDYDPAMPMQCHVYTTHRGDRG